MPNFRKSEYHVDHHKGRILSKEEMDAKHEAAMDAKTIISWKSPVRVFKARSQNYFIKVGIWGLVLILASIAFGQFFLVGVILSLLFVVYVLATADPETIEHKINNMGIISGGRAFLWEELDSFWFERRGDDRLIMVHTHLHFPTRLIILLSPAVSERGLLDLIEKHLHYHPAPVHTLMDKWAHFLTSRINLD